MSKDVSPTGDKCLYEATAAEAHKFFLRGDSYFELGLPAYFDLDGFIKYVDSTIDYEEWNNEWRGKHNKEWKKKWNANGITNIEPSECNYFLTMSKGNGLGWRRLCLTNPIFYCFLVDAVCSKDGWMTITNFFKKKNGEVSCDDSEEEYELSDYVYCSSLPRISYDGDVTNRQMVVKNGYLAGFEAKTQDLALNYDYMYCADIANCYPSIYTHSIPRALYGVEKAKKCAHDNSLVGNKIDWLLRSINYGQTNGIPQGSALYDFLAEIVLGAIDRALVKNILLRKPDLKRDDFFILRYRDDYRIFSNNRDLLVDIAKAINDTLAARSMQINVQKSMLTDDILSCSLKPDKLYAIEHPFVIRADVETLLKIARFAKVHPNSGQIAKMLGKVAKRLESGRYYACDWDDSRAVGIIACIMRDNPRTYEICTALLSSTMSNMSEDKKRSIIEKIARKMERVPNTELADIWLQRLAIGCGVGADVLNAKNCKLCDIVNRLYADKNADIKLFEYGNTLSMLDICDARIVSKDKLSDVPPVIGQEEMSSFDPYDW